MIALAVLGAIVGVLALTVVTALWRGYVLSILWAWFMVTTLGLPALTIAQALGVSLMIGMLTHQAAKDEPEFAKSVGVALIAPLFALGIGWLIKAYLP